MVNVTSNSSLHSNTLFSILDKLLAVAGTEEMALVGCTDHKRQLTAGAMTFFLNCRMHFICAEMNKKIAIKKKRKNMVKLAKLIHSNAAGGAEADPNLYGIQAE